MTQKLCRFFCLKYVRNSTRAFSSASHILSHVESLSVINVVGCACTLLESSVVTEMNLIPNLVILELELGVFTVIL